MLTRSNKVKSATVKLMFFDSNEYSQQKKLRGVVKEKESQKQAEQTQKPRRPTRKAAIIASCQIAATYAASERLNKKLSEQDRVEPEQTQEDISPKRKSALEAVCGIADFYATRKKTKKATVHYVVITEDEWSDDTSDEQNTETENEPKKPKHSSQQLRNK